jgi:hypothetical protein
MCPYVGKTNSDDLYFLFASSCSFLDHELNEFDPMKFVPSRRIGLIIHGSFSIVSAI